MRCPASVRNGDDRSSSDPIRKKVATNGGLVRFNPKGGPTARVVFTNDTAQPTPMFTVIVPEDEDRQARAVNVLYEDRGGTIWCGTMKHLYRLQRQDDRFRLRSVDMEMAGGHPKEIFVYDLLEDRCVGYEAIPRPQLPGAASFAQQILDNTDCRLTELQFRCLQECW